MTYRQFASLYDAFMEDAPYEKWVTFSESCFKREQVTPTSIVDLGCGTGEVTLRLAKKGYEMTGVDLSVEMLAIAQQKSLEMQEKIRWVQQDIRNLEGFHDIDVFISFCDVINYITEKEEVAKLFKRVYESLCPGGLFIFDVHSIHYVRNVLQNNTFTEDRHEIVYIWDCEATENDGEMIHYLTFFYEKENSNVYERVDEVHRQRTFSASDYEQLLKLAQFSKIDIFNDFSPEKRFSEKNSERIFFVATK
ncbi:MAG TPA: class I SAM-dependent methyltransferase [Pseudogracilibacillus sp.]|nr:class I SAM-dependent methyltransferase [Pseudogracilibacillus sp.]